MRSIGGILAPGLFALGLAGCVQTGGQNAGPVALTDGNEPRAVVAATATAGLAVGALGRDLSPAGQKQARDAEYRALEYGRTGVPISWKSGKEYGEVVPGASYHVNTYDCRDFTHTIFAAGRKQAARGTACRQPNGSWQSVS